MAGNNKVGHRRFYAEYFGHEVALLRILHDGLRATAAASAGRGSRDLATARA